MPASALQPPRGLFSRIMRRLGLERELQVIRQNLGIFSVLAGVCVFLTIFAFIGLRDVLIRSNLGPFLALAASDPVAIWRYAGDYLASVAESVPGAVAVLFLMPFVVVLISLRLIASRIERMRTITHSLHIPRTL